MHAPFLPYTPERDVYRLLGVPSNASEEEISAACRRLALTFHPDRNASGRATAEMQVVNAVRQVMSDPYSRAVYDRERRLFHARLMAPARPMAPLSPLAPIRRPAPGPARPQLAILRYVRAAVAGAKAVALSLAPPRCRSCRCVIASGEDAFCAACGTPLLTGG